MCVQKCLYGKSIICLNYINKITLESRPYKYLFKSISIQNSYHCNVFRTTFSCDGETIFMVRVRENSIRTNILFK